MVAVRQATADQAAFRDELLAHGLLVASGVPGLYGRDAVFESIRHRVDALITKLSAPDGPQSMSFPPLIPRRTLETIGYLHSFPQLAGSVFSFEGDEAAALAQAELADRHEDWSEHQTMSELVLVPAACYPVYPAIASFATSRPRTRRGCRCSTSARSCGSGRPMTCSPGATRGRSAGSSCSRGSASPPSAIARATRSSVAAGACSPPTSASRS